MKEERKRKKDEVMEEGKEERKEEMVGREGSMDMKKRRKEGGWR